MTTKKPTPWIDEYDWYADRENHELRLFQEAQRKAEQEKYERMMQQMATMDTTYTITMNDVSKEWSWMGKVAKPKCTKKVGDLLCERCFERPLKARTKKMLIDNYNRVVKHHGMPAAVHFLNLLAPLEKDIFDEWIAARSSSQSAP